MTDDMLHNLDDEGESSEIYGTIYMALSSTRQHFLLRFSLFQALSALNFYGNGISSKFQ